MKILIRATNWIGDAVMSLPAVRAVRDRFPGDEIAVLAKPWVAALYEGERSIDRILPQLHRERFDLGLLLPNSFRSAAILRLAGVQRIIGYARDGRSPLLTDAIPVPEKGEIPRHESFYYLELLRRAGIISALPEIRQIRFDGIGEARRRGEMLFARAGMKLPVIGVSPGAAYGGAKRWLPERFAESAAKLAGETGASIAVFGSTGEKAMCEEVARAAGGRNLAGATTLREFIDMTAASSLFLSNDSGAMHIASALGVPSVTVFGPTDETATGPTGSLASLVREPVDCAPCLLRECPIDHRCMTRVTSGHVIEAAHALLHIAAARC